MLGPIGCWEGWVSGTDRGCPNNQGDELDSSSFRQCGGIGAAVYGSRSCDGERLSPGLTDGGDVSISMLRREDTKATMDGLGNNSDSC